VLTAGIHTGTGALGGRRRRWVSCTSENLQQLPNAVNMFCGSVDDRWQDVIFSEGDVAEAL